MSLIASMKLDPTGTSLQAIAAPGSGKAGLYLASFLSGDVQGNASTANDILRGIDEVRTGLIPEWEQSGNAYTILVKPDGASLNFHYAEDDDDEQIFSLNVLYAELSRWAATAREVFSTV